MYAINKKPKYSNKVIIFNFYSLNRLDPFVKGLVARFILAHLLPHHDVGGPIALDHVLCL
jgi:hypothetical protein